MSVVSPGLYEFMISDSTLTQTEPELVQPIISLSEPEECLGESNVLLAYIHTPLLGGEQDIFQEMVGPHLATEKFTAKLCQNEMDLRFKTKPQIIWEPQRRLVTRL